MKNHLSEEKSLYLRQHADNPVEWYPWGNEAFTEAKGEDKPVLISIGYSACHWCHVMAHECFEDSYIAELMNRHFVCIKVDREERPDVDQVYMEAVQMIQGRGGWPLNVFCLPDGRPFFGGTYFPPEDRGNGLVPWPQLLMRVAEAFKRERDSLEENAGTIGKNLAATSDAAPGGAWSPGLPADAAARICRNHDDRYGGFGSAPKFPPAMTLNFLFSLHGGSGGGNRENLAGRIETVGHHTLRAMAHGGLFDQVGGGFARYSVDDHWLIPHFEKMLCDNALLIEAYTRGWLARKEPLYAAVVEETAAWLEREMSAPGGGFYAALDADSEGGEGRFYVWKPDEIVKVLGEDEGRRFCAAYNITAGGNFEHGHSNPALVEPDFEVREALAPAREALRRHREKTRPPPGRDDKVLTAWTCLAARALAAAGYALGRPEWLERARRAVDFVWDQMRYEDAGKSRLRAVFYEDGGPRVEGYLHDYALAAEACLAVAARIEWLDTGAAARYLGRASALVAAAFEHFADPDTPGFFFTADDAETPVTRRKEWFDNATPSGNSSLLHALAGIHAVTGDPACAQALARLLPAVAEAAGHSAAGVAHALEAATDYAAGIPVIKYGPDTPHEPLRAALAGRPWRRVFVLPDVDDLPTGCYQLCLAGTCRMPTDDPRAITADL